MRGQAVVHSDFKALLEPLYKKMPKAKIGDICQAAGSSPDRLPFLNIAGSAEMTCYNHIIGTCNFKRCHRYHATASEIEAVPEFRRVLCRALKPGVDKLLSRKRPYGQN